MGKLKKNSRSSRLRRQQQSLRKNGGGNDENSTARNNRVMPLIQKLSSSSPNDRSMLLSAISVLCEDEKLRKTLLKEKLVNIILEQCLNDNNDEIVVESFGLLRNLVIEEGYDVAKFLLRSKILVSLEANVAKASKSFEFLHGNNTGIKKDEKQVLFEFAENLVGLITSIATVDQEIFDEVLPQLQFATNFASSVLQWNFEDMVLKIPSGLLSVLLDFIYQLSNQSTEFIKTMSQTITLSKLVELQSRCSLNNLCQVYIEALRFHFSEVEGIANRDEFILSSLNSIIKTISSIDVQLQLDNMNKPIENTEKIDKDDATRRVLARNDLESIDIALDLIATLIEFNATTDTGAMTVIDDSLLQLYLNMIVPLLIQLLSFKDQSFLNKSLICLNNLSWLMFDVETKPVAWFEALSKIWTISFNDFVLLQDSNDLESMTDYLKLLLVVLKSMGQTLQGQVTLEQVNKIITKSTTVHESLEYDVELIKLYFVSLIGFLSNIASIQSQIDITKLITDHLLNLIKSSINAVEDNSNEEEIAILNKTYFFQLIILESISSMFEIFGDKSYDYDAPVFVANNYIHELSQIQKQMKPVYKKIDKNKDLPLKLKLEEVLSTLTRFIDYKKNE